jgi:DNA-binding transcriptional MerR regulator
MTEYSIRDVARVSGTTSRTLRHYESVGVLEPTWVGAGGVRFYDDDALVRLQEALVLRRLGMPLAEIREVLDGDRDRLTALHHHLTELRSEQHRLTRMAASVERTIEALRTGGSPMAEEMFDGFDHTQYEDEVTERWGKDAYAAGDNWWRGMSDAEKAAWKERAGQLGADWLAAVASGVSSDSAEAQALARRHADWLAGIPGTPEYGTGAPAKEYLMGLGEMYVVDPRFAANYGGVKGATLVRDALRVYAERNL